MSKVNWEKLRSTLEAKTCLSYFNASRTELIIRCPFCESNSKKQHGHLYISTDESALVFNCFRCEEKGILINLLKEFNLDPEDFIDKNLLKKRWSGGKSDIKRGKRTRGGFVIKEQNLNRYHLKRQYILGRIGYHVEIEDVPNLIFDVKNFLLLNKVVLSPDQERFVDVLETKFVGFLGLREAQIIFRNIDPDDKMKHFKLQLVKNNLLFKDFYGIRTGPILEEMNKIILCEGVFDLLVSYYSPEMSELRLETCMLAAMMGNGFFNGLSSVLDYCCLSKADIVILSDRDMEEEKYRRLNSNPQVNSLKIYYNKGGKDFGRQPIVPVSGRNLFSRSYF